MPPWASKERPTPSSQATTALVLGIVGTAIFGVGIAWCLLALGGLLFFPFQ